MDEKISEAEIDIKDNPPISREPMKDLTDRIADLSPAKRGILELRLNMKGAATSADQTIPQRESSDPAPLSFAQQRLWFIHQLDPKIPLYNLSRAIRLSGALNVEALQKSLDAIVARHEVLRTTMVAVDGCPAQVVGARRSVNLSMIDLREWPDSHREAEMHRLVDSEAQRQFDLSSDLMLRAALLRMSEKEHVLLLTTHHIASDGWSSGVLLHELSILYRAFSTGSPCRLPELSIQYVDFALWQRHWLEGEVLEAQLSYWKKKLSGLPVLELPTDRPRPTVQSRRGARQALVVPKTVSDALKALSREEGVTLFMTLLAAFQTLLHGYTGQQDIVVGSPIANRTRSEFEGLIGFFVNTLVLRTDLSGDPSFRELLARVRKVALGAYEHQDMPFERLVEELHPDRNLSHTPLFQVMFALQNTPKSSLELRGLAVSPVEIKSGTAKFDLTLSMTESTDSLNATLEYDTELFDAATISRMLGHFQTLLQGIAANPDLRVSHLPVLTEAELRQLLIEWNDTKTDYPKDTCIHQLFEQQADQSPDSVAVVFGRKQLTYRELNRRANQLAHCLQRLGVGPNRLVGLYMERSLEMIVGLLAILKAGGAYAPLDLQYPKERISFILKDSQAAVLLTQKRLLRSLPAYSGKTLCVDDDWKLFSAECEDNPACKTTAGDLAYVINTSGSTGRPKGVAVPHRAVSRLVVNTNYVNLERTDIVAQVSNCSFDAATFEIWGALLHGAQLVGIRTDVVLSPKIFAAQIEEKRISVMFLTTALFNQMAREVPASFKKVRHLLFGGEAVDPKWVAEILKHGPPERLLHVYGPTETTTFATWYLVESFRERSTTIPIGRPIANTQIYILDSYQRPVPVGVAGEVHIGGDGLAKGYLNRPELTAENFIPNPFSDDPKARMYRTGDMARYLPDGNIEFIGRKDYQVKIRGFRIEPGEVEAVLSQHPSVQQVIALVREDLPGEKRLVAYIVRHQQVTLTVSELRSFLKTKLPEYMVPSAFVLLDSLPLTPNGKVDRQALPVPDKSTSEAENSFVAPRDLVERRLAQIWEKLLGSQPIGVKDNFFDLGGHSLLAVRAMAQIEASFGKDLPLATLFEAPTIEQLASFVCSEEFSPRWSWVVPFQTGGSKPPFFCHGAKAELARHLGPDQPFYGLQPHGQDGRRAPSTVEDMASDYVKEIRTIQPKGPYYLGGYSFGGMVAFEVARQIQKQGQQVPLLVLIDPTKPSHHEVSSASFPGSFHPLLNMGSLRDEVREHLHNLTVLSFREKLNYLRERVMWRIETIKRNFKTLVCRSYLGIGHRVPVNLRMFYFFEISYQAARKYTPQVYTGSIVLFRTQRSSDDFRLDWPKLAAGGLEIHEIPGKHLDIFKEPYVAVLGEHLNKYLNEAQTTKSDKQN